MNVSPMYNNDDRCNDKDRFAYEYMAKRRAEFRAKIREAARAPMSRTKAADSVEPRAPESDAQASVASVATFVGRAALIEITPNRPAPHSAETKKTPFALAVAAASANEAKLPRTRPSSPLTVRRDSSGNSAYSSAEPSPRLPPDWQDVFSEPRSH